MEEPEKREAITELLADVTEEPTRTVIDDVFEFWNSMKLEEARKAQEEKEKALELAKGKKKKGIALFFLLFFRPWTKHIDVVLSQRLISISIFISFRKGACSIQG